MGYFKRAEFWHRTGYSRAAGSSSHQGDVPEVASLRCRFVTLPVDQVLAQDEVVICMVTTRPPKTIVKPTALGPVANTDTKFLIYGLFQKGRVLAQDGV